MEIDFSNPSFWLFIVIVNIITFPLFYFDKRNAVRGGWRVSEKMLYIFVLIGGTPAVFLGQKILHHKTRKASFKIIFWMIVLLQTIYIIIKSMGFDLIK